MARRLLNGPLGASPARWLLALAWTGWITLILVQSEAQPVVDLGIPPGSDTLERELFFTSAHLAAFAVLAALWWWALAAHLPGRRALVIAVVVAVGTGLATEWLQTFTPDRHFQLSDLIADVAGALLAAWRIKRRSARV